MKSENGKRIKGGISAFQERLLLTPNPGCRRWCPFFKFKPSNGHDGRVCPMGRGRMELRSCIVEFRVANEGWNLLCEGRQAAVGFALLSGSSKRWW